MGVIDGRGHQLGRFIAGVAEHQALVAGAGVEFVVAGVVHALGDVLALLVIGHEHGAAFVINPVVGVVVADALDGIARHLDVIYVGAGRDLTRQYHQTGIGQCLGRHAAVRVLGENSVQNRIGDLVSHLIGMAFRDRFRGEQKIAVCHKQKTPSVLGQLRCPSPSGAWRTL
ncbi:hypothetical protein D3C71_1568280 [compost metagenome]